MDNRFEGARSSAAGEGNGEDEVLLGDVIERGSGEEAVCWTLELGDGVPLVTRKPPKDWERLYSPDMTDGRE